MALRVDYDNWYLNRNWDWERDIITLVFQTTEQVQRELRWRKQRYGDSGSYTVIDLSTGKTVEEYKGKEILWPV